MTHSHAAASSAEPVLPSEALVSEDWLKKLLWAVLFSVGLGIVIQVLVMVAARAWPTHPLAETMQKITWSTLVCTGLAIGTTLRKAMPAMLGVMGVLAAPTAFYAAKAVQKSLTQGSAGVSSATVPSAIELAVAKAIEYGVFGLLIGYLAAPRGLRAYLAVGATVGVVFTGYLLTRVIVGNEQPPATPQLLARGVNECVFPMGCALVLWASAAIGQAMNVKRGASPRRA